MKIDVENFEYKVLKGSRELLKRNNFGIYCELWDNENRRLVSELLNLIGYSRYTFYDELISLRPLINSNKENAK